MEKEKLANQPIKNLVVIGSNVLYFKKYFSSPTTMVLDFGKRKKLYLFDPKDFLR